MDQAIAWTANGGGLCLRPPVVLRGEVVVE